jgi:endonuclease/exonuclease/phosphatase family metal-dependent hydrolase
MRTRILLVVAALSLVGVMFLAPVATAAPPPPPPPARPYAHLQMNLCLSGLAGCYPGTEYPKVIDEAVAHIRQTRPDSVAINEGCSGDADTIAKRTGMHASFARVIYGGAELPCTNPTGRGFFGNAVLTRDAHVQVESQPYAAQLGKEQRRWICVTSGPDRLTVCGTHLALGGAVGSADRANQDAQCAEFGQVLQARTADDKVIASGDLNRQTTCAPEGFWTLRDDDATQDQGIQHVYGESTAFTSPAKRILPATYTDHDHFLVTAKVQPGR